MSTVLQLRRGTNAQHAAFTGAVGEVTYDATKKTLVAHDGVTAGGIPLAKEASLVVLGGIVGLSGQTNAATPTTKFDLTKADIVTTRTATGVGRTYYDVGPITVDLTLASQLGGRDQAGAFGANAEVNIAYVPNGSGGLSAVISTNGLTSAPNGYTEWWPALSLRLNASGQFVEGTIVGNRYLFKALQSALSNGSGSFPTAASYATAGVPLAAASAALHSTVVSSSNANGASANSALSANSSSGQAFAPTYPSVASTAAGTSFGLEIPNSSARQFFYGYTSIGGLSSIAQTVYVQSYTVRNGAR